MSCCLRMANSQIVHSLQQLIKTICTGSSYNVVSSSVEHWQGTPHISSGKACWQGFHLEDCIQAMAQVTSRRATR